MIKAGIMVSIIFLTAVSSWFMTRKARKILSRSLGRDLRAGEETSLRAWMSVPDAALTDAPGDLGANPAERALGVMESVGRTTRQPPASSTNISIR